MTVEDSRLARLQALTDAAARVADPAHPLGKKARELLLATSGLSAAGIDLALDRHLEHRASRAALSQLVKRATRAPQSHVLLAANVFTGAFRAIALALAQSSNVFVRASRREPTFAELLREGSGGAFEIAAALSPRPGDHLWAYGADSTLIDVKKNLPAGVHFHAHGSGMGVAALEFSASERDARLDELAAALAEDTIAFDQRGCLSPRLVLVQGSEAEASALAEALATALDHAESIVPRGTLSEDERADATRYEHTMAYVGGALRAGRGLVTLERVPERLYLPPVGRYLSVVRVADIPATLARLAPRLTTVGVAGRESLPGRVQAVLGSRRVVDWGHMQKPPLDGPVDLRNRVLD